MPRMRSIKPGFFTDENIVELRFEVRLLFIGLWTLADRDGRLEDKPKQIKMLLFPADSVNVDEGLSELHQSNLIQRYSVENKRFIEVVNFTKHQYPHQNEKESEIPANVAPNNFGTNPSVLPDIPNKPDKPEHLTSVGTKPDLVQEIFEHWKTVLNHPRSILSIERIRKIKQRLAEGFTVEDLKAAIDGCKKSAFHQGGNDQGRVFDDIGLIFRDAGKVEQFIGYKTNNTVAPTIQNGKKSNADVFEEAAEFYANWPDEIEALDRDINAKEQPIAPSPNPPAEFVDQIISGVVKELGIVELIPEQDREWRDFAVAAYKNNFHSGDVIDCYAELRKKKSYRILPKYVFESLPDFVKNRESKKWI